MAKWNTLVAILDDDPGVLDGVDCLLSAYGYQTEVYSSGSAFLKVAALSKVTCAIVDVNLGSVCGIDLIRLLRQRGLEFPVVFMTASDDAAVRARALQTPGCIGFVRKPFVPESLVAVLVDARI